MIHEVSGDILRQEYGWKSKHDQTPSQTPNCGHLS